MQPPPHCCASGTTKIQINIELQSVGGWGVWEFLIIEMSEHINKNLYKQTPVQKQLLISILYYKMNNTKLSTQKRPKNNIKTIP